LHVFSQNLKLKRIQGHEHKKRTMGRKRSQRWQREKGRGEKYDQSTLYVYMKRS
jgi:hypothetical protein